MQTSSSSARIARVLVVASAGMLFGSCALGNTANVTLSRTTTIGQELIDLQSAKEQGAISDDEYRRTKADIMRQASWADYTRVRQQGK